MYSINDKVDFHYRDAIRLLYILTGLADPIDGEIEADGHTHIFIGEKRLMALDFYMRYPDYLANRLLDHYEDNRNSQMISLAAEIVEGNEPDVRTILMVRWKRGAYQKIETALSILEARGLIKTVQDTTRQGFPWIYLIYPKAFEVANDALLQQPSLKWYRRQADALKHLPYQKSGTSLKQEQYAIPEYDNAEFGTVIPTIKQRVIKRLEMLKNESI